MPRVHTTPPKKSSRDTLGDKIKLRQCSTRTKKPDTWQLHCLFDPLQGAQQDNSGLRPERNCSWMKGQKRFQAFLSASANQASGTIYYLAYIKTSFFAIVGDNAEVR